MLKAPTSAFGQGQGQGQGQGGVGMGQGPGLGQGLGQEQGQGQGQRGVGNMGNMGNIGDSGSEKENENDNEWESVWLPRQCMPPPSDNAGKSICYLLFVRLWVYCSILLVCVSISCGVLH